MKRNIYLIIAILSLLTSYQCSTNGDDIGDLYGRWKLEKFECNKFKENPDTIFFGFQGKAYSYQPNWRYDWGSYLMTDKELTLNRLQYGGNFKAIHINNNKASFKIKSFSDKYLILTRNDSTWTLKKFL